MKLEITPEEIRFIKQNRVHGFVRDLTNHINTTYKLDYSEQSISIYLSGKKNKKSQIVIPDFIINEAREFLFKQTGKRF